MKYALLPLVLIRPVAAQAPTQQDVERLAARLVQAATGDSLGGLRFAETTLTAEALRSRSAPAWAGWFADLQRQSRGFEITSIDASPGVIEVTARTRVGSWARFWAFPSRTESRLTEVGVVALPDPEAARADAYPTGTVSSSEIPRLIRDRIHRAAGRGEFSGVVLVARDDSVVVKEAVGWANRDYDVPNTIDSRFHLASMSKMFTAVAVGLFASQGRIRFGDTLVSVLPEYPNTDVSRRITIHHLLTHSAGLGMLFDRPAYQRWTRYDSMHDYLPVFANEPLEFEPGQAARYSNEGFIVLGAVLERLAGMPYERLVRQHILEPLRMRSTGAWRQDDVVPRRAVGYTRLEDDPLGLRPPRPNHLFLGADRGNAAGGYYSTVGDMFRFARALRRYRLLDSATTELMTTPRGGLGHYGYGFQSDTVAGHSVRGHGGGGPGSGINSELKVEWDGPWTVIVLGNLDYPAASEMAQRIMGFLISQDEKLKR